VVAADTGGQPLVGGARVTPRPRRRTEVTVLLDAATGDGDGDGVPDSLDDCPGVACRGGAMADLAGPFDLLPGPDLLAPPLCVVAGTAGSALTFSPLDGS